jgi:hypothetical protein
MSTRKWCDWDIRCLIFHERGWILPTRRILELSIVTALLVRPAFGLARIWATKTLGTKRNGTISHSVAEIVAVVIG